MTDGVYDVAAEAERVLIRREVKVAVGETVAQLVHDRVFALSLRYLRAGGETLDVIRQTSRALHQAAELLEESLTDVDSGGL